jgi:TatD DNase family protein
VSWGSQRGQRVSWLACSERRQALDRGEVTTLDEAAQTGIAWGTMIVIDSHCHLDFPDFAPELDHVVERAHAAGVARMVTISTRVKKFDVISGIADRFDQVYCSVGTHCLHAAEEPDTSVDELCRLAEHPKCVAIGEAGLDYHYDYSPRDVMEKGFRAHIGAARITGLPLVIHAREADADVARILREETERAGAFPMILHCFTSGRELAMAALELGAYVSFSGILSFKTAVEIRAVAAEVPEDRLLVETDAPYLAPLPYRGKRNEPAYVVNTAKVLAETRGVSFERIAKATTANFHRLFKKVPPFVEADGSAAA